MGYLQIEGRIASIRRLSKAAFDILLFAPELAESAVPGQFLHIRCGEQPLRRPISICEIDRNIGALRIVFEVRGKGTAWLSERQMGDAVDLLGPLGNGFSLPESGEGIILIGGGIGTPPLLSVAQTLPGQTEAILAFGMQMPASWPVILHWPVPMCKSQRMMGRSAFNGLVTDLLRERIAVKEKPCTGILACGPTPMLKAIAAFAQEHQIPCQVSLEERMGCGVGACLVCACKTKEADGEHYRHVCKDGPVFDAREVVW